MVREELALAPAPLGGSPYSAGVSSFALFALGAFVPLVPYLFAGGTAAVVAIVFAAVGLFAIGALITLLTGRSALFSGTRQLVFGLGTHRRASCHRLDKASCRPGRHPVRHRPGLRIRCVRGPA